MNSRPDFVQVEAASIRFLLRQLPQNAPPHTHRHSAFTVLNMTRAFVGTGCFSSLQQLNIRLCLHFHWRIKRHLPRIRNCGRQINYISALSAKLILAAFGPFVEPLLSTVDVLSISIAHHFSRSFLRHCNCRCILFTYLLLRCWRVCFIRPGDPCEILSLINAKSKTTC